MRHTGPLEDPDATVVRPAAPAFAAPVDPDATVRRPMHSAPHPGLRALDPDATVILQPAGSAPRVTLPEPRRLPLALAPGFRLHEYRVERVLGQGGFGITYLATDVHLNAKVAIK